MMIHHDDVRVNPHGGHDWIFCKGAFCLFCHLDNDDLCSYPYGGAALSWAAAIIPILIVAMMMLPLLFMMAMSLTFSVVGVVGSNCRHLCDCQLNEIMSGSKNNYLLFFCW